MRIIGGALLLVASVLIAGPSSAAGGAVVSASGSTMTIAGTETDQVITDVSGCGATCMRVDALTDVVAGPGCTEPNIDVIECVVAGPVTLTVTLGGGNDRLTLGAVPRSSFVSVDAGEGHDTLVGSGAYETWVGGDGDDRLAPDGRTDLSRVGPDAISLGTGEDLVEYDHSAGTAIHPLTLSLDGATNDGTSAPGDLDNVGTDVEQATAGPLDDKVTGSAVANTIYGGAGNDSLDGGAGADKLFGQNGNDLVTGGSGPDLLYGDDTSPSATGNDTIEAVDGETDFAICGLGTDSLHGDTADAATDCETVTNPPVATPPVPAVAGTVGLAGGRRIDANRRRTRAVVTLTCSGQNTDKPCTGTLVARSGRANVAAGSYTVAASTTGRTKVKLTRKARALLSRQSKVKVLLTLTPQGGTAVTKKAILVR